MATKTKINPSVIASEWSMPEVLECFFYLRLEYLQSPPGGA